MFILNMAPSSPTRYRIVAKVGGKYAARGNVAFGPPENKRPAAEEEFR